MNLNPSVIDFSSVITRTGTFSESLLLYQSINDKMFTPCTVRSLIVVHGHFAYYMFFLNNNKNNNNTNNLFCLCAPVKRNL